jgi:hypothetical protein
MSDYRRMKVSSLTGEHVGYLSMSRDWVTMQAMVTNLDEAYQYRWVTVNGGLRLDQGTDGGDRSLSSEIYPCWGLGPNWIVVQHHDDQTISFVGGVFPDRTHWALGGGFGPLKWVEATDNARLRFAFDES